MRVQSTLSHPTIHLLIFMLSSLISLVLASCIFPSEQSKENLFLHFQDPVRATCPACFLFCDLTTLVMCPVKNSFMRVLQPSHYYSRLTSPHTVLSALSHSSRLSTSIGADFLSRGKSELYHSSSSRGARDSDSLRAGRSGDQIPVGGELFRTRPDLPWGPPRLPYSAYRVFPGG
jgi:hypothetical protein